MAPWKIIDEPTCRCHQNPFIGALGIQWLGKWLPRNKSSKKQSIFHGHFLSLPYDHVITACCLWKTVGTPVQLAETNQEALICLSFLACLPCPADALFWLVIASARHWINKPKNRWWYTAFMRSTHKHSSSTMDHWWIACNQLLSTNNHETQRNKLNWLIAQWEGNKKN